jgi:predicted RNA binding protein YcfA (HicA-like mRNA interferase family)
MSDKLPRINAADIIRVIGKIGFSLSRQSGSHKIFKNLQGKRVTVPFHSGDILHPKTLKSILSVADLSIEKLKELL